MTHLFARPLFITFHSQSLATRYRACTLLSAAVLWSLGWHAIAQPPAVDPDKEYQLTEESLQRSDSVTQGTIEEHVWKSTGVFAGTVRRIWIYAPAKEHLDSLGTQGAAVMVFQDGHAYIDEAGQFRVPIVFDNLIHSGEMPPTIGIFIDPGHTSDSLPGDKPGWQPPPNNRSLEYDTLSSAYATFLIEEILPFAATRYRLTDDPSWRAICGISSGGICAFTVAWERPDHFQKVVSHVGSFTNIRGGHVYPSLVRKSKSQPKPIRALLQDGQQDLDNQFGNWWLANLEMEKALSFAGYDHRFVGGIGGHNGKHGGVILPESLRWLWRDWKTAGNAPK